MTQSHGSAANEHFITKELRKLLQAVANSADEGGLTALMRSAMEGDKVGVESLLGVGVDPKIKSQQQITALNFAAAKGHNEVVEVLIKHGADVNSGDEAGFTPLIRAALNRHTQCVKTLLRAQADSNKKHTRE